MSIRLSVKRPDGEWENVGWVAEVLIEGERLSAAALICAGNPVLEAFIARRREQHELSIMKARTDALMHAFIGPGPMTLNELQPAPRPIVARATKRTAAPWQRRHYGPQK